MCGRGTIATPAAVIRRVFEAEGDLELPARFNLAPTQEVPVVRLRGDGARELVTLRWGLIPFWARDPKVGARHINARVETVATTPAFREPFRRHRCLVVLDGFYEWLRQGDQKRPHYFRLREGGPFGCAGLWERWRDGPGQPPLETCTILTTAANEAVAPVHDRMPLILEPGRWADWLDPERSPDPAPFLRPIAAAALEVLEVSPRVNRWEVDDPGLIEPLPARSAEAPAAPPAPGRRRKAKGDPPEQRTLF